MEIGTRESELVKLDLRLSIVMMDHEAVMAL